MEILVRQAHPGPEVPPYRTFDQKMRDARAYKREQGISWTVLADDIQGTVHQVYGGLSDPIYLIGTDGRVSFYDMFAHPPVMHEAIEELLERRGRGVVLDGVDRAPHLLAAIIFGWPALQRGLPQSVTDLMIVAPGSPLLVWLGYQLRPLLAPIAGRARPWPAPLRYALFAIGALLLLYVGRLLMNQRRALPVKERTVKRERSLDSAQPTALPERAKRGLRPLQLTNEGEGPLYHRRYRADMAHPNMSAEALMAELQSRIDDFCPHEIARFEKSKGAPERMAVGDEYYIHIAGPWDGPVRVIDVTPNSFTLVTLKGHIEAGEIRFESHPHPTHKDAIRFEILSWARSRDMVVHFLYKEAKVAKGMQTTMWAHFIDHVVRESGGKLMGEIEILTEELPYRGEVIPQK